MEKIVLIDGHSILNRAYYGVPQLTNSEGLHTNAVYGFLNIMFMILEEEKPDYLTVAFDVHAPTFRHEIFKDYKGTRSPMDEELREQVPVIQDVLSAMNINICKLPGFEADDVLGTIAKRCQADGLEVSLVSGDRDLLQISDEHIKVRIPKTKGGKTQIFDYYPKDVIQEYQVSPLTFIDMKALMGDSSDNIKGVTGIGPKSAAKLLIEYGSIDGIYAGIDSMKASAVKENLIKGKEDAYFARTLVTIRTDAPVDFKLSDAKINDFYNEASYEWFKKLEFKNFLTRFEGCVSTSSSLDETFEKIDDLSLADGLFNSFIAKAEAAENEAPFVYGLYIPTCAVNSVGDLNLVYIAENPDKIYAVHSSGFLTGGYIAGKVEKLAACPNTLIVTWNIKDQYAFYGVDGTEDRSFDTCLAAYLLDPLKSEYEYDYIAGLYLGLTLPSPLQILGKNTGYSEENEADFDRCCQYRLAVSLLAMPVMKSRLEEEGMYRLFKEIEMPVSAVLSSMERTGIRIDPVLLKNFSETLGTRMEELSERIYEQAGEKFNILSPKQLGTVLFEKMGLKGGKKTKTGYSTSADVLEKMQDVPIVADILEYRTVSKLKSTYADGLVPYIDENSRIHTTFQQTVTATGRLSSTDPNLQNIPTRTELGKTLRAAFIAGDDHILVDADYSQIELRILAHVAGDEELIAAYAQGRDIHRITAARVFGVGLDEVTDIQRRNAKAVNFGIVYGISSYGLSEGLSISKKEAAEYIEQYFITFPGIKKYLDESVEEAKKNGYVTTLYGRKRAIPELSSSNFMQRQFGERIAMNTPIQGTAADIMKIAMINVYRRMKEANLESRIVLQVHDELLIDTLPSEKDTVCEILKHEMENAANLRVALEVDMHAGKDWLEAK